MSNTSDSLIPSHLQLACKQVPASEKTDWIASYLCDSIETGGFNPNLSRAIIFTTARKRTEEVSYALQSLLSCADADIDIRVAPFHAGLPAELRQECYEQFKSGGIHVLVATKAFGLGMDIPNIHLVVHYEPPTSLEDYLQEIGRAGRSPKSREEAGYDGVTKRIPCIVLWNRDDLRKARDRVRKQLIWWHHVEEVFSSVKQYCAAYGNQSRQETFYIPDDLMGCDESSGLKLDLGMYWLECAKRINVLHKVPGFLEIECKWDRKHDITSPQIKQLVEFVCRQVQDNNGLTRILVHALSSELNISDYSKLLILIVDAEKKGFLKLHNRLNVTLTKKWIEELDKANENGWKSVPRLQLAVGVLREIIQDVESEGRISIRRASFEKWQERTTQKVCKKLNAESVQLSEKEAEDVSSRRCLLRVLSQIPSVKLRTSIDLNVRQLVYTISLFQSAKHKRARRYFLDWLEQKSMGFLKLVYHVAKPDGQRVRLADLLNHLDLESCEEDIGLSALDQLALLIGWLRGMGYIHASNELIPFASEIELLDKRDLDPSDQRSLDYRVQQELIEANQFRENSLFALFTLVSSTEGEERQRDLIKAYFQAGTAADITDLLVERLPPDSEVLQWLRSDALEQEKKRLNEEQRVVVDSPPDQSLIIYAGPGSGKTHTLLVRLARLVHEEKREPSSILVLAYNTAVVTELRHRLRVLFERLGYATYINSINIHTFHGFVRKVLSDRLSQMRGEEIAAFLRSCSYLQTTQPVDFSALQRSINGRRSNLRNPDNTYRLPVSMYIAYFNYLCDSGRRPTDLDRFRYVLIDEFQDITHERYRMLRHITDNGSHYVTAVGDDDQSIYGYERMKEMRAGQSVYGSKDQPKDLLGAARWFKLFRKEYRAKPYFLQRNYRSLPNILNTALEWIRINKSHLAKRKQLQSERQEPEDWKLTRAYCEVVQDPGEDAFLPSLVENLLREQSTQRRQYREIAILFRYNWQVYKVYNLLRQSSIAERAYLQLHDRPRSFCDIREVHLALRQWQQYADRLVDREIVQMTIQEISEACGLDPRQDNLLLLHILCEEFMRSYVGASFSELIESIKEFEHSGSVSKLMQTYWDRDGHRHTKARVLLTTFHQSKGLEFDAVVVAPIRCVTPDDNEENDSLLKEGSTLSQLVVEELRRIVYVGLTRARDRLVWIQGEIEKQLLSASPQLSTTAGVARTLFRWHDNSNIFLSASANDGVAQLNPGWSNAIKLQEYIRNRVRRYDPVGLVMKNNHWYIQHDHHIIARLSSACEARLTQMPGSHNVVLYVSDVFWKEYDPSNEIERTYVSPCIIKTTPEGQPVGYFFPSVFGMVE